MSNPTIADLTKLYDDFVSQMDPYGFTKTSDFLASMASYVRELENAAEAKRGMISCRRLAHSINEYIDQSNHDGNAGWTTRTGHALRTHIINLGFCRAPDWDKEVEIKHVINTLQTAPTALRLQKWVHDFAYYLELIESELVPQEAN